VKGKREGNLRASVHAPGGRIEIEDRAVEGSLTAVWSR
jgi:hypothetical protein